MNVLDAWRDCRRGQKKDPMRQKKDGICRKGDPADMGDFFGIAVNRPFPRREKTDREPPIVTSAIRVGHI